MNNRIILSAIAIALLGSAAVFAQGQAQAPQHPMTFFATSSTPAGSGNLGGLAGATRSARTSPKQRAPAITLGMPISAPRARAAYRM